ncbi:MAG TPA: hypothetical protein VH107_08140 [Lacipirellulaceae bacterium]|jgi:hypothetical protein|nr:hypothetical protein [Lacipirellulaceae bacterium]
MKRFLLPLAMVMLGCSVGLAAGDDLKEKVSSSVSGTVTTWRIYRPVISQPEKNYTKIKYEEGDVITLEASGCDQTGGHGKTWKRYVDPQGPNADRLYHGLIEMRGVTDKFKASPTGKKGLVRILDTGLKNISTGLFRGEFVVGDLSKVPEKDRYLRLGFEDDDYSDNGYMDRNSDDGTGDQCKDLGTSYVVLTIDTKNEKHSAAAKGKKGKEKKGKEAESPAPTK